MPVGAAIGAVGAIGAAGIGAYSASAASKAAAESQNNALKTQQGMFLTAQNALSPFITSGTNILPSLTNEATGGDGTFGKTLKDLLTPGMSADVLATMPGFAFASKYGTMAATNALAARGLAGSAGPLGRAISDYNTGLAGQQYFGTVNALQNAYGQRVGALQNVAGMGTSGAGALAGTAVNSGNAMASTFGNIGNANASGIAGVGNALSGGLTSGTNAFALQSLLSKYALGGGSGGGLYGNPSVPGNPWSAGGTGTADFWGG